MLEVWRAGGSNTGFSRALAEAVEAEGWDGQMFMDSQSLSADPWVLMGAWALATSKLKLSTGVTNPLTRNLAVTATSAATVHSISGGRAVLGIGRGDSALAYLGHAPVSISAFERAIGMLQKLLSGDSVDFSAINEGERAPSSASLSLGDRPGATRLVGRCDNLRGFQEILRLAAADLGHGLGRVPRVECLHQLEDRARMLH